MAVIATGNVALFCQIPHSKRCHMDARWAVCQGAGGGGTALLHPANAAEKEPARQLLEKVGNWSKMEKMYLKSLGGG